MKCNTIQSQMGALLDEQLSAVERLDIISHIQSCDLCKEHFEQLKFIQQQLALMPTPQLSDNFELGLAAKINDYQTKQKNTQSKAPVIQLKATTSKNNRKILPLFIAAAAVVTLTWVNLTALDINDPSFAQGPTLLTASPEALAALDLQIKNNAEIEIESVEIATSFEPLPINAGNEINQQMIYWSDIQTEQFDQFTQIDDGYQNFNCGSSSGERGCALSDTLTVATLPVVSSI